MSERRGIFVVVLAGITLVLAAFVAVPVLQNSPEPDNSQTDEPIVVTPPSPETPEIVLTAQRLQQQEQWCESRDAWQRVLDELGDETASTTWKRLAKQNLKLVSERCSPPDNLIPPQQQVEVPALPEAERPALISEKTLLKSYPTGRQVRGISDLEIKGQGSNRDWSVRGSCSFRYLAKVDVDATVESNDGRELIFLVHFREVSQSLVLTNKTLELTPIEMPLLSIVWENSKVEKVLRHIPGYLIIRDLINLANVVDPRLRRTLTLLADQFDIQPGDDFELQAKLGKLNGKSFRMTYRSGLGVTFIEDIDSGLFTQNELIRIAYSSSLLMDQYLVPTAEKNVGDDWTVRVQDVASLLSLDGTTRSSGSLLLRREKSQAGRQEWLLGVRSGDVSVAIDEPGHQQEGHAAIRSGTIHFDIERQVILDAKLNLDATTLSRTTEHLLFGAEKLKDVAVTAKYHGVRTDKSISKVAP